MSEKEVSELDAEVKEEAVNKDAESESQASEEVNDSDTASKISEAENTDIETESNSAVEAMNRLQSEMAGEGEKAGLQTDEAVDEWITSSRREEKINDTQIEDSDSVKTRKRKRRSRRKKSAKKKENQSAEIIKQTADETEIIEKETKTAETAVPESSQASKTVDISEVAKEDFVFDSVEEGARKMMESAIEINQASEHANLEMKSISEIKAEELIEKPEVNAEETPEVENPKADNIEETSESEVTDTEQNSFADVFKGVDEFFNSDDEFNNSLIEAYIGHHKDVKFKTLKKKYAINLWAVIFGPLYALYRKMYIPTIIYIIVNSLLWLLFHINPLIVSVIFGLFFYPLYKLEIKRKIEHIKNSYYGEEEELRSYAAEIGGVNMDPVWLYIFLRFLTTALYFLS